MSLYDATNYILFANPISRGLTSSVWGLGRMAGIAAPAQKVVPVQVVHQVMPSLNALAGYRYIFVRLAALSGAAAIAVHLYYKKRHSNHECSDEEYYDREDIFTIANQFHFMHSVALMAVPLVRVPAFTGLMFLVGMTLFSGSGYYRAFGGRCKVSPITGAGSTCLIIAWLSMI